MKKYIILIILSVLFAQNIQSKNITITDALNQGLIQISAEGEGGHSGKCLKLSLKNLKKRKLIIDIPVGLIFNSNDTTTQDLMVTQKKTLELEGFKNRITKLYAACIQGPNQSPSTGSKFNIGLQASGNILKIAQFISKEKLYNHSSAQYAVWAISDNKRLENIDHKKLSNHVADLLGKPRPEYVVVHHTSGHEGGTAYQEAPSILKGRFKFVLEKEQKMTFGLYTKDGELKHAFFQNKKKIRGLHKFSFEFKVFNMPQGDYLIRLMNENKIVEEMEVSF